jgi:hypothetical protein
MVERFNVSYRNGTGSRSLRGLKGQPCEVADLQDDPMSPPMTKTVRRRLGFLFVR